MISVLWALIACTHALDNGLGLTPRLAYSTWNFFGTSATETDVRNTAAALERKLSATVSQQIHVLWLTRSCFPCGHPPSIAETGLRTLGFDTVNIDAGSLDRTAGGKLIGSPSRFPTGLRNLSDFLHGAGFKFGAYNDISGHTCGNGPASGSLHHCACRRQRWLLPLETRHNPTQPNPIQHNTTQHNTTQHNTTQQKLLRISRVPFRVFWPWLF